VAIRTKEQISILHLELRVQLQKRGALSFDLSGDFSWCSGFREPWNISALCSHSTVRGRRHRNGRVYSHVYSGCTNRGPEDQDFEEEEHRGLAGGIFKQRGIGPTGWNHASLRSLRLESLMHSISSALLEEILIERRASVALSKRVVDLSDFYLSSNSCFRRIAIRQLPNDA
jgi:hypothetical protein